MAVGPLIKCNAAPLPAIIVPRDRRQTPEGCALPVTIVPVGQQTRLLGPGSDVSPILTVSRAVRTIKKPCATLMEVGHAQMLLNRLMSKA